MTYRLTTALPLALLFPATAPAQSIFELDEIIFSGGFTAIAEERYGRSADVVTSEDIEARGLSTVQDAIRSLPGVSVSASGGNLVAVRIRGGEANHTLILIDGIEAAGGDGSYNLSGLDTANIERIEVLRGPNSVFYGSNASAGVINIITRRGGIGQEGLVTFETGGGTSASSFVSSRTERGGVSASLSFSDDYGWDFSGDGGERDGTERTTFVLSGDYFVTDDLQLGFTLRRSDEDYEFDRAFGAATTPAEYIVDDPTQFAATRDFTGQVYGELSSFEGRVTHRLSYSYTETEQRFGGGAPTVTDNRELAYRFSVALDGTTTTNADHLLNVIIEREEDSSSASPLSQREALSYAVEYRGTFDNGLSLQAGVRHDNNDPFNDVTVWNLAGSYSFANGMRLHASAGTGSVNPDYFELYANAFNFVGNPNLTPERNRGYDIGLEFPIFGNRGTLDVTYFNETLTDEITSVPVGAGFSFINQLGDSTREGVEVTGNLQATDDLSLRLAYTYLEARNPDGSVEVRRPQHELLLGATLAVFDGRGSVSADIRHVAGNFDTQFFGAFPTLEIDPYTVVNVSGRYDLTDRVAITGRIENLFDTDYSDVWGYAARPLTAHIGLQARF